MNYARSAGMAIGIMIGIILIVVCLKFANRDHKMETQYDERQMEIRGKAYRLAFYTLLIYEAVMMCLDVAEIQLPVEPYFIHFLGIVIGGTVLAEYTIWHDSYWGQNNNIKRYVVVFAACILLNLIPLIGPIRNGSLMENGKMSIAIVNLVAVVLLVVILITTLLKMVRDRNATEEE